MKIVPTVVNSVTASLSWVDGVMAISARAAVAK